MDQLKNNDVPSDESDVALEERMDVTDAHERGVYAGIARVGDASREAFEALMVRIDNGFHPRNHR